MKLKVQITPYQILELESPSTTVTVGRSPNNDLVIPHDSVSRTHCQIEISPKGVFLITDLESSNGTYVDGTRLTPKTRASVLSASQITIGRLNCELCVSSPKLTSSPQTGARNEGTQKLVPGALAAAKTGQELGVNDPAEVRRLEGTRTRIIGPRNPVSEDFALEEKELYFKESKRPYILMFIVVLMILIYLINIGIK